MKLNNTGLQSKSGDQTKVLMDRQRFDMYENFVRQIVPNFNDQHAKEFILNADNATMLFYWMVSIKNSINPMNLFEEQKKFLEEFDKFLLDISGLGSTAMNNDARQEDKYELFHTKIAGFKINDLESFKEGINKLDAYNEEIGEIANFFLDYIDSIICEKKISYINNAYENS